MRTSPLMPCAAPMRPISSFWGEAPAILLGGRGFGGGRPVGRGLGAGLGAFGRLLARLGALGVVARGALGEAGGVEEAQHAVGRLGADAQPMLDALGDQRHALARILELGVVMADLLDEAAVTRAAGIGDDDVVVGALRGAGTGKADLERHALVLGLILGSGSTFSSARIRRRGPEGRGSGRCRQDRAGPIRI